MGDLDRIVAVDWSGRLDAAGQRRHIWAGIWTAGRVTLEAGRTREELVEWLIAMSRETPRMVVSLDCCFSFPAWFLAEHGCATVFEFWRKVATGQGELWLARECEEVKRDARFWGKPHKRPEEFCGENLHRSMRITDMDNKITPKLLEGDPERAAKVRGITPKSPFQIGGSGSVGTGSLRAMPFLMRLHEAGFRVWPFESAKLAIAKPQPLLVEMYTRLLTGAVKKSNAEARKKYLAERRYEGLGRGVMAKALGSEDAFDALVCCMEMVRFRDEFAQLKATKDDVLGLEGITWRPGI
ncbi:hypothetical protein [Edaphobacter modestus]|uniref:DUF429 domain-containing protein n=1 Tax=Edaphobacter modestus TaxID=388466 RepID=A0A4Q7YWB8_9BACT|nr:hypothetical protein [Edaphobacter modestus]RZU41990.1 hypothetical protein BDD14_3532 [Edaphobacter modestus]